MKKISQYLLIIFLLLTFLQVSDVQSQNSNDQQFEAEKLKLNSGKKWKVIPSMLKHIRKAESEVNAFEKYRASDYKKLSKILVGHLGLLTSNCTMKGQAHDQLHIWLAPYMDLVEKLSSAKTPAEQIKTFQEIKQSYKTFNTYFN